MVPWMAVFEVGSLLGHILEFLSSPLCHSDCYTCNHIEITHLENVGKGFLRCCAVIAGRDDGGGFCRVCEQATDVAHITFRRFDHARRLHYRLLQNLLRVRRSIEEQVCVKVDEAAERHGDIWTRDMAKLIYLNERFALEQHCPSQPAGDSDEEATPTY